MLRALFPNAVFKSKNRAVHADIQFHSRTLHQEASALIDSGATDNFISLDLVDHFFIPTINPPKPKTVWNLDRTRNSIGTINQAAHLDLTYNGKKNTHNFYVIDLGEDHMVLGMPFLAAVNPEINWTEGELQGKVIAATTDAHKWIPNKDSKVSKTFIKRCRDGYMPCDTPPPYGECPFLNVTSEDYIQCTTTATKLAAEAIDTTKWTWQELIPAEYHRFSKVFSDKEAERFPDSRPWDHAIDLTPEAPPILNCKVYPLAEEQQELLDKFLQEHKEKGYICQSNLPYASPFFFVKKKDGKLQPVQDYHALNQVTIRNTYPLLLIKELVWQLVKKKWFTKFDICWGYNNVHIKNGNQWKAMFKTNRGLFKPTVMFFGLTNSPATFQTMMDEIFKEEVTRGNLFIYMDDILIATTGSLGEHCSKVAHVLTKLRNNDLFLKPEKCHFHKEEVEYLGVIVGKGQVKMDPIKVQGITDWPIPTNLHEVRSFLGFGNYYKDFIANYSHIMWPLHDLTKKSTQWHWDELQCTTFETLKKLFMSYPVLQNPDPTKCYILDTDVSKYAVGATISQQFPDGCHPITYYSKSLLPAEHNYDIYNQELLAIIYAVKAFRYLLLGAQQKFLIWCDHENLKYFKSPQKISACQAWWNKFLQDYNFELIHFPGQKQYNCWSS